MSTSCIQVRDLYTSYVEVNNLGARENGYEDAGDYRRKAYEVDNLDEIAENFLVEMQPLYEELHGYVRYKLSKVYPDLGAFNFRREFLLTKFTLY